MECNKTLAHAIVNQIAYELYQARELSGIAGDAFGDWLEAERLYAVNKYEIVDGTLKYFL